MNTTIRALFLSAVLWIDSFASTPRQVYVQHKAAHALVGIAVYEAFRAADRPKTGLAVVLTLGVAKELYDRKHGGRFRPGDVAWTVAPATLTYSVRW